MTKKKLGKILISFIGLCFLVGFFLSLFGLEKEYPAVFENVLFSLTITASVSGLVLWGLTFIDYLDNRRSFKSPSLVFLSLLFFNWVAAIVYFFVVISPSDRTRA